MSAGTAVTVQNELDSVTFLCWECALKHKQSCDRVICRQAPWGRHFPMQQRDLRSQVPCLDWWDCITRGRSSSKAGASCLRYWKSHGGSSMKGWTNCEKLSKYPNISPVMLQLDYEECHGSFLAVLHHVAVAIKQISPQLFAPIWCKYNLSLQKDTR